MTTKTPSRFRVWVESVIPTETGMYYPDRFLMFADGSIDYVYTSSFEFKDDTCKFTLMQWTGLTDKNEDGIYEGDFVLVPWSDEPVVVELGPDDGNFHYLVTAYANRTPAAFQVLGNIYEGAYEKRRW